MLAANPG